MTKPGSLITFFYPLELWNSFTSWPCCVTFLRKDYFSCVSLKMVPAWLLPWSLFALCVCLCVYLIACLSLYQFPDAWLLIYAFITLTGSGFPPTCFTDSPTCLLAALLLHAKQILFKRRTHFVLRLRMNSTVKLSGWTPSKSLFAFHSYFPAISPRPPCCLSHS